MNESELISALQEAIEQSKVEGAESSDGDFTRREVMAWLDIGDSASSRMLRGLADAGLIDRVKVLRVNGWGNTFRTLGYRLAEKPA